MWAGKSMGLALAAAVGVAAGETGDSTALEPNESDAVVLFAGPRMTVSAKKVIAIEPDDEEALEALEADFEQAGEALESALAALEARWRRASAADAARLGVMIKEAGEADGVLVVGLVPDGGADEAGVRPNDVIIEVNGESLRAGEAPAEALRAALRDIVPGDEVRLVVLRDGRTMPIDVVTTSLPAYSFWAPYAKALGHEHSPPRVWRWTSSDTDEHPPLHLLDIGQDLGGYFGVESGVLVLDTPARSQLKPGDILRRVDGADVASAMDARRLLAAIDGETEAEVLRKKRKVKVTVKPAGRAGEKGAERMEVEVRTREDD